MNTKRTLISKQTIKQLALLIALGTAASAQAQLLGGRGAAGGMLGGSGSIGGQLGGMGSLGSRGALMRAADTDSLRRPARNVTPAAPAATAPGNGTESGAAAGSASRSAGLLGGLRTTQASGAGSGSIGGRLSGNGNGEAAGGAVFDGARGLGRPVADGQARTALESVEVQKAVNLNASASVGGSGSASGSGQAGK